MPGTLMHMAYVNWLERHQWSPSPVPPTPVPPPEIFTVRVVIPAKRGDTDEALVTISLSGLKTSSEFLPILVNGIPIRETPIDGVDILENEVYLLAGDTELTYCIQIDSTEYIVDTESVVSAMQCVSLGLPYADVYIESFGHACNLILDDWDDSSKTYETFYMCDDGGLPEGAALCRLHVESWHNAPCDIVFDTTHLVSVPESWSSLPRNTHGLHFYGNESLVTGGTKDADTLNVVVASFSNCPNWKFDAYGLYQRMKSIGCNPDRCTIDIYDTHDYYYGFEGCFARCNNGIGWDSIPMRWGGGGRNDDMSKILSIRLDFTPSEGDSSEMGINTGFTLRGTNGILNIAATGENCEAIWDENFFDLPGVSMDIPASSPSSGTINLTNMGGGYTDDFPYGYLFYMAFLEGDDSDRPEFDIHIASFGGAWHQENEVTYDDGTVHKRRTLMMYIEPDYLADPDSQFRVHIDSWTGLTVDTLNASNNRIHSIPDSWEGIHDDAWIDLSGNVHLVLGGVTGIEKSGLTRLNMSGCVNWEGDAYAIYEHLSKKPNGWADFSGCTKAIGWDQIPASWGGGKPEEVVIDGLTYKVIRLNDKLWLAENLQAYSDLGDFRNDDEATYGRAGKNYGRYYRGGYSVDEIISRIEAEGLDGWRVPTGGDFDSLADFDASELKSTTGWVSGGGTDKYGFNALPAGGQADDVYDPWFGEGDETRYWGSDPASYGHVALTLDTGADMRIGPEYDDYGLSIRLVKDIPPVIII